MGNLLDNAFEAVLLNDWKHRSVGLEIKEEQGIYIIYVCNNGPTIPKEEEERVFKAGYTTKGSQGRGYGLFLVRNIIESYGAVSYTHLSWKACLGEPTIWCMPLCYP